MKPAPIALFTYNRPLHLEQTVDSLRANDLASESELYVFSDAARDPAAQTGVGQVRSYLRAVDGFKSVNISESPVNLGVAASIINGVTKICKRHGRVIVVEDDLSLSRHFLKYMNDALNTYADETRVISVHGYIYPFEQTLPETFFVRGADCWGWATWQRGWDLFEPDGARLLRELESHRLLSRFDLNGAYDYSGMLKAQIKGLNDSWAIRWSASALIHNKLTLYPGRSLVHNTGNDSSGQHCGDTASFDVAVSDRDLRVGGIPIEENLTALAAIEEFLRNTRPTLAGRVKARLARWL